MVRGNHSRLTRPAASAGVVQSRVRFPDDFTYLGSWGVPDPGTNDSWYGRGITGKTEAADVGNETHFISTNIFTSGYRPYEYRRGTATIVSGTDAYDPNNYPTATLSKNYADAYDGKHGSDEVTGGNGLLWVGGKLLSTYGHGYDNTPAPKGWLLYSELDYAAATGVGHGPFTITAEGYKHLMDGAVLVPQAWADAHLDAGGDTYVAVGFGGGASTVASGDVSMGTSLTAVRLADLLAAAEGGSVTGIPLVGYWPFSSNTGAGKGRMNRPAGVSLTANDYSPYEQGNWGSSKAAYLDGMEQSAAVWIDTATKRGVLNFYPVVNGMQVYLSASVVASAVANACAHLDPDDFTPASGTARYDVQPYDVSLVDYPVIDPAKFDMGAAKSVTSIASDAGKTLDSADGCLVTCTGHGFVADDRIQITGAAESAYVSLWHVASVPSADTFYIKNLSINPNWPGGTDSTPGMVARALGAGDFVRGAHFDPDTEILYLFTPVSFGANNSQRKIVVQEWQLSS
jgi:hypothetical protein